jgi:hypothetical protein
VENWPNASNTAVSYFKTAAWFYGLFLRMRGWPSTERVPSPLGL